MANQAAGGGKFVPKTASTSTGGVSAADVIRDSALSATPTQDPNAPGLMGADRFNRLMASDPYSGMGSADQESAWLQSVPDDPNDPAFTQLLQARKAAVLNKGKPPPLTGPPAKPSTAVAPLAKGVTPAPPSTGAGRDRSTSDQAAADAKQHVADITSGALTSKRIGADEAAYRQAVSVKPIITGLPVDAKQILSDATAAAGATGIPTDWLKDFTKNWDLDLQGDFSAAAVKSGDYVYVGRVNDASGGKNFMRDKYTYVDDAKAMLAGMSPDKIKIYQAKLGLQVTGLVDEDLQSLWDASVKQAGWYARTGKKVDLQFIFDTRVAAEAARRSAGGGGGNGLEKGPTDQAGVDYYRAMMQVLGDISGVNNVA